MKKTKVAKREELLMLRLMQAAGNGARLMLKPAKVQGMKMQQICGLASNELQIGAMTTKLVYGYGVGWVGDTRMVITGKAGLLQKQRLQKSAQSLATHRQERLETDMRKLVLKPLAKVGKGQEYSGRLQSLLTGAGLSGIQSVGFSPDKYPENPRSGVFGFVVFASQEQRDAAITDSRTSNALMTTEFQLEHRVIRSE